MTGLKMGMLTFTVPKIYLKYLAQTVDILPASLLGLIWSIWHVLWEMSHWLTVTCKYYWPTSSGLGRKEKHKLNSNPLL